MTELPSNETPRVWRVDLSSRLELVCGTDGIAIEVRDPIDYPLSGGRWNVGFDAPSGIRQYRERLFLLEAGRQHADGREVALTDLVLEPGTTPMTRRTIEGTARYEDGAEEYWRMQADTLGMRLLWIRQGSEVETPLFFRMTAPLRTALFQFWRCGSGLDVRWNPGGGDALPEPLDGASESELLFYSLDARHGARFFLPSGGSVSVAAHADGAPDRRAQAKLWQANWRCAPGKITRFSATFTLESALSEFHGPISTRAVDASIDFGPFYAQMLAGGITLNSTVTKNAPIAFRQAAMGGPVAASAPVLRDLALAGPFLALVHPELVAGAVAANLTAFVRSAALEGATPAHGEMDPESAAWALLLLDCYRRIVDGAPLVAAHLQGWRACAMRLLRLRRRGEALPISPTLWPITLASPAKDVWFAAVAARGLETLSDIEETLHPGCIEAQTWASAAEAMRSAANTAFEDGGLWHSGRRSFVARRRYPDDARHGDSLGTPQLHHDHAPIVGALWLNLQASVHPARDAIQWIDDTYSYADGRPESTFPPGVTRNYFAWLDVYVRHRDDAGNVDTLLQRLTGRALDLGLPVTAAPFGRLAPLCPSPTPEEPLIGEHAAGCFVDNAPFFGLVLGLHYGLAYRADGWRIEDPKPLQQYPLTRVTNLRYKHARYSISWQGTGRIRRVTLNGNDLEERRLDVQEGDHEVVVYLG